MDNSFSCAAVSPPPPCSPSPHHLPCTLCNELWFFTISWPVAVVCVRLRLERVHWWYWCLCCNPFVHDRDVWACQGVAVRGAESGAEGEGKRGGWNKGGTGGDCLTWSLSSHIPFPQSPSIHSTSPFSSLSLPQQIYHDSLLPIVHFKSN